MRTEWNRRLEKRDGKRQRGSLSAVDGHGVGNTDGDCDGSERNAIGNACPTLAGVDEAVTGVGAQGVKEDRACESTSRRVPVM
jgi:hypothetical protein